MELAATDSVADGKRFGRISEFDGLRGVLAWTVVAVHLCFCSGYFGPTVFGSALLSDVAQGAVDLFILLSGFAITRLILEEQERYRVYLWRRACRLVPAYWLALALAMALNGTLAANYRRLQSPTAEFFATICDLGAARWRIDPALHFALVHGLAPTCWLPFAAHTYLGVAWSISLEWQFYCLAPVAVLLALRHPPGRWIIILLCASGVAFSRYLSLCFSDAFLPLKGAYFLVGAASYSALKSAAVGRPRETWLTVPPVLLALLAWGGTSGHLVEALIAAAGWFIVTRAVALNQFTFVRVLLNSRLLQSLGRVSYSTYLFHVPVITIVQAAIWRWINPHHAAQLLIYTAFGAVTGTLAVSEISWRFVEQPFQRLGRKWRH